LKALFKLLARIFFGLDVAFGMFWCVFLSLCFGGGFNWLILVFSIFCAISPDFDFLLWKILRKKFKIQSHQNIFHHPLIFIPGMIGIGYVFASLFEVNTELVSVVVFGDVVFHFLHDSYFNAGMHWGWPFSWTRITFCNGFPKKVNQQFVDAFYKKMDKMKEGTASFVEEITKRSAGTESLTAGKLIFWLFAASSIAVFAFYF